MKNVVVIPARGGSVGIKVKNLKLFCGRPLIYWAIKASQGAQNVSRIIVSTDSEDIAQIAREAGAEVPFIRPIEMATSTATIEPVLKHAYEWLRDHENYKADFLSLVHTTSPLRNHLHVSEAFAAAEKYDCDGVIGVCEVPANHTPFWSLVLDEKVGVRFYSEAGMKSKYDRRQEFPIKNYCRNDLMYVFKPSNLYAEGFGKEFGFCGRPDKIKLLVSPSYYDGDLNSEDDWVLTENLFRTIYQGPEAKKFMDLSVTEIVPK